MVMMAQSLASPMTITVESQSMAGDIYSSVYVDGDFDTSSPRLLDSALAKLPKQGAISVFLNSRGGNLFAGMEVGRIIRKRGASTHIGVNSSELKSSKRGGCYSACSLAYLGGIFRFMNDEAEYGVHRFSNSAGPSSNDLDIGQILSSAITGYIADMDVDTKLFHLMTKVGPDNIYVLSPQEIRDLRIANNGRLPPKWEIQVLPRTFYLRGFQETQYGTGKAIFQCQAGRIIFLSVYSAGEKTKAIAAGGWTHSLRINDEELPLAAPSVRNIGEVNGFLNASFQLTATQVEKLLSARSVGHAMKFLPESPVYVGYDVDIDTNSTIMVRDFLNNCLRTK
jgi:hypothetical protein